ncbi:MAG: C39 family peptidase [Lachnospiraceae bacterium]|nr:C39 family peptidase [Lachnospiraceae bacterium]
MVRILPLLLSLVLLIPSDLIKDPLEGLGVTFFYSSESATEAQKASVKKKYPELSYEEREYMTPTVAYVKTSVGERTLPDSKKGKRIRKLKAGSEITVIAKITHNPFNEKLYYLTDSEGYIDASSLTFTKPVILPVDNIMQYPELPNGCEITSLTIVMNYKGYEADKCDMADLYLPQWPNLKGDPNKYFLRNPRTNGFYCFAGALCIAIDNYNLENYTNIEYEDLTGCETDRLYEEIDKGNPVVVWGTLRWNTPRKLSIGLYRNLHCMVLSGYTEDSVIITDPIYGITEIPKTRFESVWIKMERRALVVTK